MISRWFNEEGKEADMVDEVGDKVLTWKIENQWQGQEMEGVKYEQLLPYAQPEDGDAFKVLVDDFVTTEDGTGIVHIAPSFGADDRRVALKYGVGSLTLVVEKGRFTSGMGEFAGRYVKEYEDEGDAYVSVDVDLAMKLQEENRALNVQRYEHSYR